MREKLDQWINQIQYNEILSGESNCPGKLLGIHPHEDGQVALVFRPCAREITIVSADGSSEFNLDRLDDNGFFGSYIPKEFKFDDYRIRITYGDEDVITVADPYSFDPIISDDDLYLFGEGNHYEIYNKLGAHPMTINGVEGVHFAVWAPDARSVSVVGNFNMWDGRLHLMNILGVAGLYELFVPGVTIGDIYKFQIRSRSGQILMKSDPYANSFELRPKNASIVANINSYDWTDDAWIEQRDKEDRMTVRQKPISIYEVHPGSWRKHDDGTDDGFYNYRELAHELAAYVKEMGYTHVELMGISEHPFDGSWGYQVTGYFAPTRRFGTPEDFMYFIDYMHSKGISIILDWVPAHFPKDDFALARFDGEPVYEHPDKRRGEHPHWGTYIFNYGKKEVENFLIANALFWLEKFHVDGLRVDAVASMLYLDYGKENGEWLPNPDGTNANREAVAFMQHMNQVVEDRVPGTMIIAEESTAWAGVTAPASLDGLGFGFKWNMGWMNDFLNYMKLDPYFRSNNHGMLTFSMHYAYAENYIQVISHDEVVHGKCSMINKMPGEHYDKFANLRTAYGFMYAHPGKKLLFMGQEFAQYDEWCEAKSLDWYLLEEDSNAKMQKFVKKLNALYQKYDALYYYDYEKEGFTWVDELDAQRSIIAFIRKGKTKKDQLLFVFNFTPVLRENFQLGVPCSGTFTEVLNSDAAEFGGASTQSMLPLKAKNVPCNQWEKSITFDLPPLSCIAFRFSEKEPAKKTAEKKAETAAKTGTADDTVKAETKTEATATETTNTEVAATTNTAGAANETTPSNTSKSKTYKSSTKKKGRRRR